MVNQIHPKTGDQTPLAELLGLDLLRTSGQLLRAHWWKLLAIAACGYVVHELVLQAAVRIGRGGAVPGLLIFSLVPLVPLIATVGMLLIVRVRQDRGRGAGAAVATIASVLVPFLVVYESQGDLLDDQGDFFNAGFNDDQAIGADTLSRIPDVASVLVLVVVVVAFLLRSLGSWLTGRDRFWEGKSQWPRTALHVLTGYSEAVWIVLGATLIRAVQEGALDWWRQRNVGNSVIDWWEGISLSFPNLAAIVDGLVLVVKTLLDGAVTGVVTPIAWLAIGVVAYGVSAAQGIGEDEVLSAVKRGTRLRKVTQRLEPEVIALVWRRIADTGGRFGALLGGLAMILRSRFVPVLTYCIVFTVLTNGIPYAVWWLARFASLIVGPFEYSDWLALYGPIHAISEFAVTIAMVVLLAAWADAMLVRFGAPSQVRLPIRRSRRP